MLQEVCRHCYHYSLGDIRLCGFNFTAVSYCDIIDMRVGFKAKVNIYKRIHLYVGVLKM
jgi:hypothetical protein